MTWRSYATRPTDAAQAKRFDYVAERAQDSMDRIFADHTLDALVFLVERSGRLVSKSDLMQALWPDTFVDESNLTQTVFMLRKALGETGSEQRYITTVPTRGYRFIGHVRPGVPVTRDRVGAGAGEEGAGGPSGVDLLTPDASAGPDRGQPATWPTKTTDVSPAAGPSAMCWSGS